MTAASCTSEKRADIRQPEMFKTVFLHIATGIIILRPSWRHFKFQCQSKVRQSCYVGNSHQDTIWYDGLVCFVLFNMSWASPNTVFWGYIQYTCTFWIVLASLIIVAQHVFMVPVRITFGSPWPWPAYLLWFCRPRASWHFLVVEVATWPRRKCQATEAFVKLWLSHVVTLLPTVPLIYNWEFCVFHRRGRWQHIVRMWNATFLSDREDAVKSNPIFSVKIVKKYVKLPFLSAKKDKRYCKVTGGMFLWHTAQAAQPGPGVAARHWWSVLQSGAKGYWGGGDCFGSLGAQLGANDSMGPRWRPSSPSFSIEICESTGNYGKIYYENLWRADSFKQLPILHDQILVWEGYLDNHLVS